MPKYKFVNFKADSKKTMTTEEFAHEYNIGLNKAYEIVNRDGFPAISLGRKKLIIRSKVDAWLESNIGKSF